MICPFLPWDSFSCTYFLCCQDEENVEDMTVEEEVQEIARRWQCLLLRVKLNSV